MYNKKVAIYVHLLKHVLLTVLNCKHSAVWQRSLADKCEHSAEFTKFLVFRISLSHLFNVIVINFHQFQF